MDILVVICHIFGIKMIENFTNNELKLSSRMTY